jgi:general secretion pathway protein A
MDAVYLKYFNLKADPFNLTPDPQYMYLSQSHREALARIQFGIEHKKGFIVLTGEVGSGKTTVIRTYLQNSPPNQKIALIVNTKVTSKNLLQNICRDFGIKADYDKLTKDGLLNLLYDFILQNSFYGINLVVIIDEAHDLGVAQLEEVRLLTNLETNTQKLLQVVLVGQPELWDLLNMPQLRALKQRIFIQYELRPLSFAETQHYIIHRLKQAGSSKENLFTPQAIQKIYHVTQGTPRLINVVCSNALALAFSRNKKKIDVEIIEEVVRDVVPTPVERPQPQVSEKQPDLVQHQLPIPGIPRKKWKIGVFLFIFILLLIGINVFSFYIIKLLGLF